MAKSQVTEEDLAQGIQSLGGFGNLGGQGARRDSPFGTEFVRKPQPPAATVPAASAPPAAARPIENTPDAPLTKKIEVVTESRVALEEKQILKAPALRKPLPKVVDKKSEQGPKSDTLTDRITLQMSPEMRDAVSDLARHLQRKRREKGERITANTVMRVAIQAVLNNVEPKAIEGPSSEDELLSVVEKALK